MNKHTAYLAIALVIMMTSPLTGCWLAAAGAGGAAGYYMGQDERTAGEITSDAAITAKINAKYVENKDISAFDINVDTRKGVVTLFGSVSSAAKEQIAIDLAKSVKGVKEVISKLTIVEE